MFCITQHISRKVLGGGFEKQFFAKAQNRYTASIMAITKEKKVEILKRLKEIFTKAESVVFLNFHGLPVAGESEIRKTLHSKDIGYYVAKKTLVKRVLFQSNIEGDTPSLDGELALVYGTDSIAPAREISEFIKKHKENLSIQGGIFENTFMNREEMNGIAVIPPLEVLYGQFANLLNSPIQGFAVVLDQIAKQKA